MIPEAKQAAVARGLRAAFGVTACEDIAPLSGGLSSALAFKIGVGGQPYLLKILRAEIISNPATEFACMQSAAGVGIAPRVWYASVEDRLLISDYVEAKALPGDMALRIARSLRTLHGLPGFPPPLMGSYLKAADGFIQRFRAANLLPESATAELFALYAELIKVYPRDDAGRVASHNDVKPQNMRFDGQQLWLVDWESAFLNDEYVDLAIAANFFVRDEAGERAYLAEYFGQPASDYQRARFFLMRQILSLFYTAFLLMDAARSGLVLDADLPTPDFWQYHRDLAEDKIEMLAAPAKREYGMLHLREALRCMRSARFAQSLAVVAAFHGAV